MNINFNGIPVYLDPRMGKYIQTRFPRSKKRRIRRKWSKNCKNYGWVSDGQVYQMGNALYMHPSTWEQLKKTMRTNVPEYIARMKELKTREILNGK